MLISRPTPCLSPTPGPTLAAGGQIPGDVQRFGREVDADHIRTEPGPGDRVGADVALQVEHVHTCHVAQRPPILFDDAADCVLISDITLQIVMRGLRMHHRPSVPIRSVCGDFFRILHTVAHRCSS